MEVLVFIALIVLGLLFLLVELLLLPGFSIGGILSLGCYGWAIYLAFADSMAVGFVVSGVVALLSLMAIVYGLRAKTWQRLSLKNRIESQSSAAAKDSVAVGSGGVALSRLAPMGKVLIEGVTYQAKSLGGYIDEGSKVEVMACEDSVIIVKQK